MRHILPTRSSLGGSGCDVMSWGQWMVVNWTIEEELQIESRARIPLVDDDAQAIRQLCCSLVKQNAYYERILRQATARIMELETAELLASYKPKHQTFWKKWLNFLRHH